MVGAGQERLDQTLLHLTLEVDEGLFALAIQRVEEGGGSPCPSAFVSPPSWRWTSQLLQQWEDHIDGHFCDRPEVKGIQMVDFPFLRQVVGYGTRCNSQGFVPAWASSSTKGCCCSGWSWLLSTHDSSRCDLPAWHGHCSPPLAPVTILSARATKVSKTLINLCLCRPQSTVREGQRIS